MSHIQQMGGYVNAVADYQEYMARLGAEKRARRNAAGGEKPGVKTFDSAMDEIEDSDRERGGSPDREAEGEPGGDAGVVLGWSIKA